MKLPKELDHPKKGLINIHNLDNIEWFKWCLVINPARIRKIYKLFGNELDFEDIKFPVKTKDIQKI